MSQTWIPALGLAGLLSAAFVAGYYWPTSSETQSNEPSASLIQKDLPDFSGYTDIKQKKKDFFQFLLPLIRQANQQIKKERAYLLSLDQLDKLAMVDVIELEHLMQRYEVDGPITEDTRTSLLQRINTIPASLVLAQAANESAWGTSRFAKEGNNLFGQWCYSKGCGLIPKRRGHGQVHEVAKFDSVADSIASYMRNLNTQVAYEDLRRLRASRPNISGHDLAQGLLKYSTRREAYVHEIQLMIRQNKLGRFD